MSNALRLLVVLAGLCALFVVSGCRAGGGASVGNCHHGVGVGAEVGVLSP